MENDARARVLVVDDVPDNIMVLDELLRDEYNVFAATSGQAALDIVESSEPPDLVLLDIMMPGMNGFEVCRRIKGNDRSAFIPVVMVTALSGHDDRIEALHAGADDFLVKPTDPVEVMVRVKSLLRIKKLHDELQQSFAGLQKLEQLRENLTHMIIHDMRTPLTGIIGALDLIPEFAPVRDYPEAMEMHDIASQNSEKLLAMINDLLDITKLESGELQIDRAEVDLAVVAKEVENTVRAVAQLMRVEFTSQISLELPKLSADHELLCRVLVNLVANALKFTPGGGHALLTAEVANDGMVKLTVQDDGPGVPVGYEDRIFEKFGQVETGERKKLSSGLGLTFCKMAVDAHGGKIWVESAAGRGSSFHVLWPAY